MKLLASSAILIGAIFSLGYQDDDSKTDHNKSSSAAITNVVAQTVEASCGECQFGMDGDGCHLAIRIDGKSYFVDGTSIDDHGDAHGNTGLCNCIRMAKVAGKIKNGRFVAASFKLLPADQEPAPKYNAELAKQLGADEYGMKSYVFVILKTGKVKIEDKEKSKKIFAGHFANMRRLGKAGKLVVAGPFVDAAPNRGIYIFNVTTIEAAEKLVKSDPAVKAGVFDYEMTKLYCSAALMKINDIHTSIQKTKIE